MRRRAPLALALLALALVACGRALSAPVPAALPSPAASPAASAAATAQPSPTAASTAIQLTGALTGQATAAAAKPCGPQPAGFAADFPFSYQGQAFALTVTIADFHGAGAYPAPPARISVRTTGFGSGSPVFFSGVSGTVTVLADGASGTLDENLLGEQGATAHVSAAWHC